MATNSNRLPSGGKGRTEQAARPKKPTPDFPLYAHHVGRWAKKVRGRTVYLLFVVELKTRRVHFAGCTTNPHENWMKQHARNLTDAEDGFLHGKRYGLMDQDG